MSKHPLPRVATAPPTLPVRPIEAPRTPPAPPPEVARPWKPADIEGTVANGLKLKPPDSCSTCLYSKAIETGAPELQGRFVHCRCGHPTVGGLSQWPIKPEDDWCGDFEPKSKS